MEENWWSVSRELSFEISQLTITSFTQYIKQNLILQSLYSAEAKYGRNKSIQRHEKQFISLLNDSLYTVHAYSALKMKV